MQPLEVLDAALARDHRRRPRPCGCSLDRAAAEIQLRRRFGEHDGARARPAAGRSRSSGRRTSGCGASSPRSVHASLDLDHVVQRAVEVVGDALEVDRVHIRLRDHDEGRLAAEWRRSDDVVLAAAVVAGRRAVSADPPDRRHRRPQRGRDRRRRATRRGSASSNATRSKSSRVRAALKYPDRRRCPRRRGARRERADAPRATGPRAK